MGHLDIGLSKDIIGRGSIKVLLASSKLFGDFGPLFQSIGRVFNELDPEMYSKYKANYQARVNEHKQFEAYQTLGRCC